MQRNLNELSAEEKIKLGNEMIKLATSISDLIKTTEGA
jgi:hypothetical protein